MAKLYKALLVPVDGEIVDVELSATLRSAQLAIGGHIELVGVTLTRLNPFGMPPGRGVMVVDEEGLLKNRPRNTRASTLHSGGDIRGPVLIFTWDEFERWDEGVA